MKLLHIDSSISGASSISRQLTAGLVAKFQAADPGLDITYRDLAVAPVPQQSPALLFAKLKALHDAGALAADIGETVAAALENGASVDSVTQAELAVTSSALDEFLAADIVVIGAPMYNFGIPSQLKAWIDILAAPGKTFRYTETGVEGLATGKRVIIASSRGGFYSGESPMGFMDHQERFLTSFLGFIGIADIEIVRAEGINISAEQRQSSLHAALIEAGALAA